MSAPSPYTQRNAPNELKEDCRDYLRTGRCKYAASCKYNHPANVQSGGGVKPLDPSEPMFPLRPNEPLCQYYVKHGTCKFGHTCKFNHPPQSSLSSGANGNALLVGGGRKNEAPQVIWNSPGGDNGVLLLPQRPDEPNCIFFLKNGRCKYGSTCRYHHPLNYHERRAGGDDGRRQHVQVHQMTNDSILQQKIQYVTSLPPGSYQQGHFVVADGSVTFYSLDGSSPTQVITVPQGNTGPMNNRNLGQTREVGSSSSSVSIASSYETASSNLDPMGQHGESSSSLWTSRPKRVGSCGSLNAYNLPEANPHGRTRGVPVHPNDSSHSLPRVASAGSNSESGTVYYDANTGPSRQMQSSAGVPWRGRRSSSFDHTRSELHTQDEDFPQDAFDVARPHSYHREPQGSPMMHGNPPPSVRSQRRPQQNAEDDDGLSMMTSALLTMLDTPEDARAEDYQQGYDYEDHLCSSQSPTPRMGSQYPSSKASSVSPNSPEDAGSYNQAYMPPGSYYDHHSTDDPRVLGIMMPRPQNRMETHYDRDEQIRKTHGLSTEDTTGWSPSWQDSAHAQSMPMVQHSRHSSNSPHGSSQVGLYLP